jgi:hypothetical protein
VKNQLIIATGLAVLSTSAFATKTRMNALGQGDQSFYLNDSRSIFVNAAALNNNKNYVVTEWGDSTSTTPAAEGGFFREMGSFAYGLYLGNEESAITRSGSTGFAGAETIGESDLLAHDNAVELFFAGDMGLQWGAKVHYSSGESKTSTITKEQDALGVDLGIIMGNIEAYVNLDLKDESKGGDDNADKFEADLGLNAGLLYRMNDLNIFADYAKVGAEYVNGTTAAVKTEQTSITVGAAKVHEVSSTARVIFDARYTNVAAEDTSSTATKTEKTTTSLPLTMAFETDANSWMTLRGSVSQKVIINKIETKTSTATTEATDTNTATVNAGASLNFGKLKVDGTIGGSTAGSLNLDTAMMNVAVSYWF